VVLEFTPIECSVFSEEQKQRLLTGLRSRLTKEGILQISAQEYRSQHANKELALAKFIEIMEEALRPPKKRRRTRIPLTARYERLQNKKHRSQVKERRRAVSLD
jgi:ribosome-associated protein